ncbi:MAG TPA: PH domain-containing protein [Ktedonobacterales bacterium]
MSTTPPQPGPSNHDAPTSPLRGGTAPLRGGSQGRGQIPRWQGRPATPRVGRRALRPAGPAFRGQMAGETPIFVHRQHPIFLVLSSLPLALTIIALVVVFILRTGSPRLDALLFILQFVLVIVGIILLLKWLILDLPDWLFNIYVLTDRRLIDASGFFTPNRKEANLDRIQQVQVDRTNIFEYLLDLGDVRVVTAGAQGDLTFDGIAHPLQIADQIREAEAGYRKGARTTADVVEPKHPVVKKVLDDLARPIVVDQPQAQPHRTFGGFLRRPAMIRYLDNEVVMNYIYRHWFVLFRREIFPALLLIVSVTLGSVLATYLHVAFWSVVAVGVLASVVWGGLIYLNYADDVFILTTDRIIDIDRFVFVFFEGRKQADYSKVQDVRVSVDTLIARIFNFGDITVETAGRLPNIEMSDIPDPFAVQDLIFQRMTALKERDAAAAANRQRLEYRRMIATTMNELLIEVPDVRHQPVVDAGQTLSGLGLRMIVAGERRMPGMPPGVVAEQMPNPGSTVLNDSEVRVVLSGRA